MTIVVVSRRRSSTSVEASHPGAAILDVTSRGPEPWVRLSPFYPHGGIPVPLSPGRTGRSVEGIWQALKVFEGADVDPTKLTVGTMRGLKRTVRANGPVRGHRAGLDGDALLPYVEARRLIYLPAYHWMLEHRATDLVRELRETAARRTVVLLDYTTNGDVTDERTPLSHAALVRAYVTNAWPS
ncbi:hypothetical protein Val02_60190 [Virgisporangium aliadipatigenens]|uniref:Uncharacterized protein n=1 Tax=Virgisporangium aliadipatigenens TaxID=741659 RepID=A0A8J3YSU8_9ACTN|nr:hypothetical protein [Virgisporangium aliadipatigenens]GIJ49133.1 hypothetical protein Val02_60190 [Virgisporangium aliadipatigenens]